MVRSHQQSDLKILLKDLDSLYRRADQLGEACDILNPKTDEQLSRDIAEFFAKMITLQNAHNQIKQLSPILNLAKRGKAITQCTRYVGVLKRDARDLLQRVNVKTGVGKSYESQISLQAISVDPKLSKADSTSDGVAIIGLPKYRSPSWVSQPAYARSSSDDGIGYIFTYFDGADRQFAEARQAATEARDT